MENSDPSSSTVNVYAKIQRNKIANLMKVVRVKNIALANRSSYLFRIVLKLYIANPNYANGSMMQNIRIPNKNYPYFWSRIRKITAKKDNNERKRAITVCMPNAHKRVLSEKLLWNVQKEDVGSACSDSFLRLNLCFKHQIQ